MPSESRQDGSHLCSEKGKMCDCQRAESCGRPPLDQPKAHRITWGENSFEESTIGIQTSQSRHVQALKAGRQMNANRLNDLQSKLRTSRMSKFFFSFVLKHSCGKSFDTPWGPKAQRSLLDLWPTSSHHYSFGKVHPDVSEEDQSKHLHALQGVK